MSSFSERLGALVADETAIAVKSNDGDALAEIVERLLHSAGFSIAIMGNGDPKLTSEILEGCTSYLLEVCAGFAPIGSLAAQIK